MKKRTLFSRYTLLFSIPLLSQSSICWAQSKAHSDSKFAIIDPAYNSTRIVPASTETENRATWIYGPAELECWRLQLFIKRKDSAKLNVGYTGAFHVPSTIGSFQLKLQQIQILKAITFRAVGGGKLYVNNTFVSNFKSGATQTIQLKQATAVTQIKFEISTPNDLPALLMETKELSTANAGWQWKADATEWQTASHFPQNMQGLPPHLLEDPTIKVQPRNVVNNLYDFGGELLGYVFIKSKEKPMLSVGESEPEATDTTAKFKEQSAELISVSNGVWKTKYPVAFRYAFSPNTQQNNVWCEAIFRPEIYKGAFACSDTTLTKIWMNSAYTLRLCMHDFLLDGIKRDRLPWAGDLAMSSLVNAYTFADAELTRRSLVALGRAGIQEKDINGIIDFSLWWIIAQDQYQLYHADTLHLQQEWSRIKEVLQVLSASSDKDGFLVPRKDTRLFIDWVKQEKWTALQVLWWWAQNSAAKLATRMGDVSMANEWSSRAKALKTMLTAAAWSQTEGRWLSKNDSASEKTKHPNFFAVASGLAETNQYAGIREFLENEQVKGVGSPYMAGFEVIGLAQLGNTNYMLRHVKDYWGGMLNKGATTFWEAYNPGEKVNRQYSFYSRPYGKSLCHAWSSGPAAFLPAELLGLKPIEDGWKRFMLKPNIGSLQWVSAAVPTPYGSITVDVENTNIKVVIPKGTSLDWKGKSIAGPFVLQDKL